MTNTIKKALSFLTAAALCAALITLPAAPAFADDEAATEGADSSSTPAAVSETTDAAVADADESASEAAPEAPADSAVEFQPIVPISASLDAPVALAVSEFSDVVGHWAATDIEFVNRNGLFSGVGDGRFDPNGILTRGMLVTVLGRYDGIAPSAVASGFSDVAQGAYYAPYIAWASFNGIATGVGGSLFQPDSVVTREQAAKIIASYLRYSTKIPMSTRIYKPPFTDADAISDWAAEDVSLIRSYGLLDGRPDGSFDPKASLTRAEAAALLKRFVENMPRGSHQNF